MKGLLKGLLAAALITAIFWTPLAAAVFIVTFWKPFRKRWWKRVHYQGLWGKTYPTDEVKCHLFRLLEEADRVFNAHGVPYWLDWGTLLGAYRHQGFIPWDDDLDITIRHADHRRVYALRGQFSYPYKLVLISDFWSFDKVLPCLEKIRPCKTFLRLLDVSTEIYLDIFEVGDVGQDQLLMLPLSWMHVPKDARGQRLRIDQAEIFPLAKLPFEGQGFPVPRETEAYLHRLFGPDLSPDHVLDETTGKYLKRSRIPSPEGSATVES